MPTSIPGADEADCVASPATASSTAAARAMRLRTYRLRRLGRERAAEPFGERDLGLPAEDLAGTRDVGLANLRIVLGQGLVDDLALRAGRLEHDVRELEKRELVRIPHVDRHVLGARREQVEAADQVVDVAE